MLFRSHGNSIGGVIVDGGNFNWTANKKRQPFYNEPDSSYGGAVWGEVVPQLTGANIPFIIRARVVLLRDLGAPLSPFNAFQIIQGLETLALRMRQHCSNAEKVVNFLTKHSKVQKVIYKILQLFRRRKLFLPSEHLLVSVQRKIR